MQQRLTVMDRSNAEYKAKYRASAFVHGLMDGHDGKEEATLMVHDFYFLRHKNSRIKYARLVFEFMGADGDSEEYVVRKISPDGHFEVTTESQTSDSIKLTGETESDEWGNEHVVKFALSWNETQKTSIPLHLRVAILLRRPNDEPFHCVSRFEVQTDYKSSIKDLFSRREVDNQVVINPTKAFLNKLRGAKIDADDLGVLDLDEIFKCTYQKA